MPQIRQFEAPEGIGLRPSETGINAVAAAARRVQSNYNEAAADITGTGQRIASTVRDVGKIAVDYAEHREKSAGAPAFTGFMAGKTKEWDDINKNADPNDPTVAGKFLEGLEPELEKFKSGFMTEGGQQWAEHQVDQFRQHMTVKAAADMSANAGHAAKINAAQTVNNLSNTVRGDPSSLDFAFSTLETTLGASIDSSPNLRGSDAARVRMGLMQTGKQAIAKSAAFGYIEKTGKVPDWATSPKYSPYINGMELRQFEKAAEGQRKQNLYYEKGLEQFKHAQDTRAAAGALGKTFSDNVSFDANGKPTINPQIFKDTMEIVKQYPDVAMDHSKALINWAQSQQKEKREVIVTDPQVQSNLYDGLFRTENPTTDVDILKAAAANKLDSHATSTLIALHKALDESPLKGPVYHDTMNAVKSELIVSVPSIPGKDTIGIQNYAKFVQTFVPDYLSKQRNGALPPNALDVKDPASMISQAMAPYKRTQSQRMADYISIAGGITAPTASSTRKVGDVPVPPLLNGIAALQYNKTTGQFRDQTSGKIYDRAGNEVKP